MERHLKERHSKWTFLRSTAIYWLYWFKKICKWLNIFKLRGNILILILIYRYTDTIYWYKTYAKEDYLAKTLDWGYTYKYRKRQDFLCVLLFCNIWKQQWTLQVYVENILWKNAPTGPATPYCWGPGGVILKLNCDTHLAKLLSTFNCKT